MTSIAEQVGRVVGGRYRLLAPVGTGASSQVYAASDTRLARRVAVKVLHPMLAADRAFLRRFRAEARLAASLDHPHIMRVFDWGEESEGPYLVLEYLGGGSLRAMLDTGGKLTHSQVAGIGAQAAAGLAYAHRRGIIHRDIKPSNLLFDDEGHLRIADFGVARALAESALTEPLGAMFGTARYASPEQAEGRGLDDRTDVYSLALVLYESLTGRVPFSGDTIAAMLMARVGAPLPPSPELGPLAPILGQAAISEPLARLDAAALQSDLELLVRELPPAEPLPLARTSPAPGVVTWSDRDPTVIDAASYERMVAKQEAANGPASGTAGHGAAIADAGASGTAGHGAGAAPMAGLEHEIDELTLLGLGAEAEHLEVPPASTGFTSAGLLGDPTGPDPDLKLGTADPEALAAAGGAGILAAPGDVSRRSRRRAQATETGQQRPQRRRYRWVAWAVVVAVLLAAGGAAAAEHGLTPAVVTHEVPNFQKLSFAQAKSAAARVDLTVTETSAAYSATVPAGEVISQSVAAGRHEHAHTVIGLEISKGVQPVPVPSLVADNYVTAIRTLTAAHLRHRLIHQYNSTISAGVVIDWNPKNTSVAPNTVIVVTVSKGRAPVGVPTIPATDTFQEAKTLLTSEGFKVAEATQYSLTVAIGDVIKTTPSSQSGLQPYGTLVTVVVSKGPQSFDIPDVRGDSVAEATQRLEALGFVVDSEGGGVVVYTFPVIGSLQVQGTVVHVFAV
jgi:eukaryotic-like serine/threonine-protein kinase